MISESQIKALSENELAYLYYCLKTEWDNKKMNYEFDWYVFKSFRNDTIQHLLNQHSSSLKDEYKNIVVDILNKLEQNY